MSNYHKHFATHRQQFRDFYKLPSMSGVKGPGYMARKNAFEITEYAAEIFGRMDDGMDLPAWMDHKLSQARQMIGDVKHKIEYMQKTGQMPMPREQEPNMAGAMVRSTDVPTFGARKREDLSKVPTFARHKSHYRG